MDTTQEASKDSKRIVAVFKEEDELKLVEFIVVGDAFLGFFSTGGEDFQRVRIYIYTGTEKLILVGSKFGITDKQIRPSGVSPNLPPVYQPTPNEFQLQCRINN